MDDKANLELFRGKTPLPQFDFPPLDHVELGEKLDLVDFEGGARVAGHGFYFLKNEAVLLELALQRYALEVLMGEGFTPITTPDLARNEILEGVGFIPRGPETQIYSIEGTDLSLVATAEITLGGLMAGQTIDAEDLPIKLCGIEPLLPHGGRRPRPGHAADCSASTSSPRSRCSPTPCPAKATTCSTISATWSAAIFDGLGMPYRVVDTATGDLGGPGLPQVRPGGLDARPRRVRRSHQHLQLHRLPGPAAEHPLQARRARRARGSSTRSTARPSPSAGP